MSYADDTAVIASGKTWKEVETNMNKYLARVFLTFGNYRDSVPQTINITINNERINRVTEAKYLGVLFDTNMKWDKHIEYLIKKTLLLFLAKYPIIWT